MSKSATASVVEQAKTTLNYGDRSGLALFKVTDDEISAMDIESLRAYATACRDRIELIGRAAYVDKGGHVIVNNELVGKNVNVNPDKRTATKINPFSGKASLVNNKPQFESKQIGQTIANAVDYVHGALRLMSARGNTNISLIGQGEKTDLAFVSALAVAKERTW